MSGQPTVALVHGMFHGGWCFDALVPELHQRGYATVTMDLPSDDPDAGAATYAEAVLDALRHVDGPVLLVGHSAGGLTVPIVASRRPVEHLCYIGAALPRPGLSAAEWAEDGRAAAAYDIVANHIDHGDGTQSIKPESAREVFYHDCSRALADRAIARLRPQGMGLFSEVCPISEMPDVPTTYVVCSDDRSVSTDWSRKVAREWLGIEPVEIPGGHSPFLSRPGRLADLLVGLLGPPR